MNGKGDEFIAYKTVLGMLHGKTATTPAGRTQMFSELFDRIIKDDDVRTGHSRPDAETAGMARLAASNQRFWDLGRPYYKVYSSLLDSLCRTRIDVPGEYFKSPFDAWEVRVPKGAISMGRPGCYVTSVLIYRCEAVWDPQPWHCDTFAPFTMSGSTTFTDTMSRMFDVELEHQGELLELNIHYRDEHDTADPMKACGEILVVDKRKTVEEAIINTHERLLRHSGLNDAQAADRAITRDKLWRLIFSLSFLITGEDRLVQADVLSKDIQKLKGADAETMVKLHLRATRRRNEGKGYTVGRSERLLELAEQRRVKYLDSEQTRELSHSHVRSGHFHGYHTKKGYTVKWIPPLVVRPDLPADPRGRAGVQVR